MIHTYMYIQYIGRQKGGSSEPPQIPLAYASVIHKDNIPSTHMHLDPCYHPISLPQTSFFLSGLH